MTQVIDIIKSKPIESREYVPETKSWRFESAYEDVPSETIIPLAPIRILRERNDNEENYDDHYNNYLFPTKKN